MNLDRILSQVKRIFRRVQSILISYPHRIECNLCGWQGRRFLSDGWHANALCPRCDSQIRHRLLVAVLQKGVHKFSYEYLMAEKHVLHFAPESLLVKIFKRFAEHYETADLYMPGCDRVLDISDMRDVPSASVDLLIACDVLEHVKSDHKALAEINRVLVNGGVAILTVPQKDGLKKTYEDEALVTPQERKAAYGISDHWRIYGDDFLDLLKKAGFQVSVADHLSFTAEDVERYVLFPSIPSNNPLATNHRKIFFARRK